MIASQLIVHPIKGTLAELIDAHNALVRHLITTESKEVAGTVTEIPIPHTKADVATIRNVHTLLLLWGYRCNCVFPQLKQPYNDLYICLRCNKPYSEPLGDD